jgi:hypothetical protein
MESLKKFGTNFLNALTNEKGGHSLRKLLAVGCFWVMTLITLRYTSEANIEVVLGIYSALITALVITYTAGNIKQMKKDEQ